jgi:hypothetical protein
MKALAGDMVRVTRLEPLYVGVEGEVLRVTRPRGYVALRVTHVPAALADRVDSRLELLVHPEALEPASAVPS